ncbi:phage tail terminator-like protein [Reyranella sp.]|uniref:phage tail terminator-like protein n=1 Tax=Reyranella sp. TaxID=1929291 RepID=UPI0040373058
MTVEEKIEDALFARVATLELTPALPVAFPNLDFPGKAEGGSPRPKPATYLGVQHFPNRNVRIVIKGSGPHLRQGILQLTVVAELNTGHAVATKAAGEVAAHFPADLLLEIEDVQVRITQAPSIAGALRSDGSWDVPVSIQYECFA